MAALELDDVPIGLVRVEPTSLTVLEANQAAATLLHRTPGELAGALLTDLVDPAAADGVAELLAAGDSTPLVVKLAEEPPRWLELCAGGTPEGPVVVVRDATEQVRTFRVLREAVQVAVVTDDAGVRVWGPVGQVHPEDCPGDGAGSIGERIHPEDAAPVLEMWKDVVAQPGERARFTGRVRVPPALDAWGPATFELANLRDVPEVGGILLTIFDHQVDERIRSLARTSSAYLSLAEAAPVGIILMGPAGLPVYFNAAARSLIPGCGPVDEGLDREWFGYVRAEEREEFRAWLDALVEDERGDTRLTCFDAPEPRWLLVTVATRETEASKVIGWVVTLQDVTAEVEVRQELEAAHERMVHLATHDPLTGVANRALLAQTVAQLQDDRRSGRSGTVGVVFCDVDRFKVVNDEHGHDVGDHVLVAIAERLRALCRAEDLVVRIGGDEFLVIVRSATAEQLDALRERIGEALTEPIDVDGTALAVGVSAGTALLGEDEGIDAVLRRADAAMYEHKAQRRDADGSPAP